MTGNGRKHSDWITSFLELTEGIPSPPIYRLWAGIATIAGALERRLWVVTAKKILFPNLYTLLVAPPGVGKSNAIEFVTSFWMGTKDLHVSPDNMTKAALVDALASSLRAMFVNNTDLVEYHSLQVASSEFGVLVPAHELDFISTLNHIYDNPQVYRELRRGRKEEDDIHKPQLNIVAGTQPAYLSGLLPEEAWGMGFMSRIIMIYSGDRVEVDLFDEEQIDEGLRKSLQEDLNTLLPLYGRVDFHKDAIEFITKWHKGGLEPIPEHSKLHYYNSRRIMSFLKLCMISAASSGHAHLITLPDAERAKGWLLHAETFMPDVFKEMAQKSDGQVIADLHFFVWRIHNLEKKPVHKTRLVHFLQTKVPSEKIARIIDTAVQANILDRAAGSDMFTPRPKNEHGVE